MGTSYITFNGIAIFGANITALNFANGANHIVINGCNISFNGVDALQIGSSSSHDITVTNSTISYTNNNSINASNAPNWIIQNNLISNSGMIAGMGQSQDGMYFTIANVGTNSLVASNEIANSGYVGITFLGSNITVQNNYIHQFCMVKDDGGAIYTSGNGSPSGSGTNMKVLNNLVLYGGSAATLYGTDGDPSAEGLYVDDAGANVQFTGNTVAFINGRGIHFNSASNLQITNNTFYSNLLGFGYDATNCGPSFATSPPTKNVTQTGNIFFAQYSNQRIGELLMYPGDNVANWGTWDNNYYTRPVLEPQGITNSSSGIISLPVNGTFSQVSLDIYKAASDQDPHTQKSPVEISDPSTLLFEYNSTATSQTFPLSASYIDVKGNAYSGSITLAPYTSVVLIPN